MLADYSIVSTKHRLGMRDIQGWVDETMSVGRTEIRPATLYVGRSMNARGKIGRYRTAETVACQEDSRTELDAFHHPQTMQIAKKATLCA